MASLTLALVVICAAGLSTSSTRWLGLLCLAVLVAMFPVMFLVLSLMAAGAFLFHLFIKRRN